MSQDEKQPGSISVVALRAESYSANGDFIVISLRTKYSSAERKYSIPIECFYDLILDLHRLNALNKNTNNADDKIEPLLPLDLPIAAE